MSTSGANSNRLAEQYARLWETTSPELSTLDTFLAAAPNCHVSELAEILRTDLIARWRAGQPVPAEDYIRRLGPPPGDLESVVDLIYTEFLIREELGQSPGSEEYYQRFPNQADVLRDQFALHAAMDEGLLPKSEWATTINPPRPSSSRPLPAEPQIFPRSFGRYQLLSSLGQGGMGNVYLARDERLDRQVAVKIPRLSVDGSPAMIARFLREAQAAAALNHPQLCPVYDVGQVDGVEYLTMPFIAGGALSDRLKKQGPLSPTDAVRMVIKIAGALDTAHQAGVVHRDLKPANVLITEAGEPIITDFGLAVRTENHDPSLTAEGGMLGTIAYMPPEQIGYNAASVGPRSDVYSLGVILFELLTGRTPFIGADHEVLRKTLSAPPIAPSKVRPQLSTCFDAVCLKALAKSPDDRFASMADFAEQLTAALSRYRVPRRKTWRTAILVGLVALLCLGGFVATRGNPDPPKVPPVAATDPFKAGSVWSGTYHFLPPTENEGPVTLSITERTGESFVGEYATIEPYRWRVRGTTHNNVIQWVLTEPLNGQAAGAVGAGQASVEGRYTAEEITGIYHDKGDNSQADLKFAPQR